jgi:hypothetical protein
MKICSSSGCEDVLLTDPVRQRYRSEHLSTRDGF